MTLPSTITTKHGKYRKHPTTYQDWYYLWEGENPRSIKQYRGESGWSFSNMTPDEVIEFLQAYKEARSD